MTRACLIGRTKQIANNMLRLAQEAETSELSRETIQNVWHAMTDAKLFREEMTSLNFTELADEMKDQDINFRGDKQLK